MTAHVCDIRPFFLAAIHDHVERFFSDKACVSCCLKSIQEVVLSKQEGEVRGQFRHGIFLSVLIKLKKLTLWIVAASKSIKESHR